MKNKYEPLKQHQDHQIEIQTSTAYNLARYWCCDCGQSIAWLSKSETDQAIRQGLIKTPHFNRFFTNIDK